MLHWCRHLRCLMSRYQQQFTNFLDCFITKVEPAKPETSDCFITKIEPAKRHKQFHQKLGAIKVEQPETWSAYRKDQPVTSPAIRTIRNQSIVPKSKSVSVSKVVIKGPSKSPPRARQDKETQTEKRTATATTQTGECAIDL